MKPGRGFWDGIAAGCAFVVVSLLARLLFSVPTLPELVQDRLVLLLPGAAFSFILDHLLYFGKPLLFASLLALQIALAGFAGMATRRWSNPLAAALALWLLTGLILLPLAGRGLFGGSVALGLTLLVDFAAWGLTYALFAGRLPVGFLDFTRRKAPASDQQAASETYTYRRRLLAGGLLGLAAAGLALRAIGKSPAALLRAASVPTAGGSSTAALSPLAVTGGESAGLPPAVTPLDRFYVVSKNLFDPELNGDKWSLRIDGLVSRPATLRFPDIAAMPAVQVYRTLECISNEIGGDLISNGQWTGAHLADVLDHVGVKAGATAMAFTSADGYTATMPLDLASDAGTLLVYRLGDDLLSMKHGYPLRVLATRTYGMKNPKWLTHIELVATPQPGYWQRQGWDEQGIVQTMSEVIAPADGAVLHPGALSLSGIAYAGSRGVSRVEVSTDGGTNWRDATLVPALAKDSWTFWRSGWQFTEPGAYTVLVRATDATGTAQTDRRTDPFPVGATGYHQVRIQVAR